MARAWNVAVVGATGLVGREMLRALEERRFPVGRLRLLASERSAGETIPWRGDEQPVEICDRAALVGHDLVLMAAGAEAARQWAPAAVAAGARVVDNSPAFRAEADVPLVVPEVNGALVDPRRPAGVVANPNCAVIQLVTAVAPLHAAAPLRRLVVSTYQAVSGQGQGGMNELGDQVTALWRHQDAAPRVFAAPIAFNILAQIGVLDADGHSSEEAKMVAETRRLLGAPDLAMAATCVRVPVFNGHAISVVLDVGGGLSVAQARARLAGAAGVALVAETAPVPPTPQEVAGSDLTWVGRLRAVAEDSLALWCVADNLRKGAAVNAVQIAEIWHGDAPGLGGAEPAARAAV